jgi:hypothetical protein
MLRIFLTFSFFLFPFYLICPLTRIKKLLGVGLATLTNSLHLKPVNLGGDIKILPGNTAHKMRIKS